MNARLTRKERQLRASFRGPLHWCGAVYQDVSGGI